MDETARELALALMDTNAQLKKIRVKLGEDERARIAAPIRRAVQVERARIKEVLWRLDGEGRIDMKALMAERGPSK